MGKLSEEDREKQAVNNAIQYNKGFLDALEAIEGGDIYVGNLGKKNENARTLDEQIDLVTITLEDYEDRLNTLRKTEKRINGKKKNNARRSK